MNLLGNCLDNVVDQGAGNVLAQEPFVEPVAVLHAVRLAYSSTVAPEITVGSSKIESTVLFM